MKLISDVGYRLVMTKAISNASGVRRVSHAHSRNDVPVQRDEEY